MCLVVIGACMSTQISFHWCWQCIVPGQLGSLVMFMHCDLFRSKQPGLKYTCKASAAC